MRFHRDYIRVSHSGVGWGGAWGVSPQSYDFFRKPLPSKSIPPSCPPPLKNEDPSTEKLPPPLKSEAHFQEMIPKKTPEKLETVINTCVSIIKQH